MASSINASTSGAGGVITTADNTGILNLQTASTTAVTIDASQNVGIGTTSPTYKVDINNAASRLGDTTGGFWQLGASSTASQNFHIGTVASDSTLRFYNGNYGAGTERMRIDSSGNVLVGSTATTGFKFEVSSGACARLISTGSVNTMQITKDNTGGTFIQFVYSASQVGFISTNGTTTTYGTSSDYRLKDNIVPMTGALDKVAQLKPVTYTWKADGSDGQGFIAHELQEVIPDAVVGKKDAVETYTDEDGIEQTRIKPQGVDTSFLVATLTAAIQEQQTIINDLKARIETLEAK